MRALRRVHRSLAEKVAVLHHARHFHHAAQLHFAPVAANARRSQRGYQSAGLGAQVRLCLREAAHLFVQRGVRAGPRLLQFLDPGIHLIERGPHGRHQVGDGALAQGQLAPRRLLGLRQRGPGQVQERLIVARQRVGRQRFEGRVRFARAAAQNQPRQRKPGYKTEER